LRASVISETTLSFSCSLLCNTPPSKQSGPIPLLKLQLFTASTTSSRVNAATLLLPVSICISSSSTSKSTWTGGSYHVGWSFINFSEIVCHLPLNYFLIIEDCHLTLLVYFLNFRHHWVCSPDLQQLICFFVEFLHLPFSHESGEVLYYLDVV
jgi:hypothetical protein